MAVRIIDLQQLYGVEGAREKFERLGALLIRSKFPSGKRVRVHRGDGGVDAYVGYWTDIGNVHVFQVKFFSNGLGESQKEQIRKSFKACVSNSCFTTTKWTLCLPVDLSKEEILWFDGWRRKVATGTLTSDNIEWWEETELTELLFKTENQGTKKEAFTSYL